MAFLTISTEQPKWVDWPHCRGFFWFAIDGCAPSIAWHYDDCLWILPLPIMETKATFFRAGGRFYGPIANPPCEGFIEVNPTPDNS